jgi:sugar phosphate isomerase/epimerase
VEVPNVAVRVGIQLYSVRQSMGRDPFRTLERLTGLGFRNIEAANHNADADDGIGFGVPARDLRAMLDRLGMDIVGCHINPLSLDRVPRILDYHRELGNTQVGCDIEFFPYGDVDYILRRAELFNDIGELCRERGMRFYYHNHYQEFQFVDGRTVYDLIMENTDPDLVFVEMDTYWMARGGQDPVAMMKKYSDRLILLHQKDFPASAPQPLVMFDGIVDRNAPITMETFLETKEPLCFTEIGTGVMSIQAIIDTANECPNFEYLLLEQDHSQLDELASVERSRTEFDRYAGISWD